MSSAKSSFQSFIGIDGGGSSTKGVAFDRRGRQLTEATAGPSNPGNIGTRQAAENIAQCLSHLGLNIDASCSVVLGIAGVANEETSQALQNALLEQEPSLARCRLQITHDLEIAAEAAFGGSPGLIVIAGTGSAAYAITPTGERLRKSGRSYTYDDPGSGYAIAQQGLKLRLLAEEEDSSRDAIARRAIEVMRLAERNNPLATGILSTEAQHLARLASPLLERFNDPPYVALRGGTLETCPTYRTIVENAFRSIDDRIQFSTSKRKASAGAARLAWKQVSDGSMTCPI